MNDGPFFMVVAIVMIGCVTGIINNWIKSHGSGGSRQTDRRLQEQERTIAELRQRVENLEAIVTDPAVVAAANVHRGLGTSATPARNVGLQQH